MNGHAMLGLAQNWATVVHDGRSRKGAGEPYIEHCRRVAESPRLWGWRQKALAWQHDSIEDSDNPQSMLDAVIVMFGQDFARDLLWLSRLPRSNWLVMAYEDLGLMTPGFWVRGSDADGHKETYQDWIERIASDAPEDVQLVKLADLEDNLKDISDVPGMRNMESRYLRAKATLLEALDGLS